MGRLHGSQKNKPIRGSAKSSKKEKPAVATKTKASASKGRRKKLEVKEKSESEYDSDSSASDGYSYYSYSSSRGGDATVAGALTSTAKPGQKSGLKKGTEADADVGSKKDQCKDEEVIAGSSSEEPSDVAEPALQGELPEQQQKAKTKVIAGKASKVQKKGKDRKIKDRKSKKDKVHKDTRHSKCTRAVSKQKRVRKSCQGVKSRGEDRRQRRRRSRTCSPGRPRRGTRHHASRIGRDKRARSRRREHSREARRGTGRGRRGDRRRAGDRPRKRGRRSRSRHRKRSLSGSSSPHRRHRHTKNSFAEKPKEAVDKANATTAAAPATVPYTDPAGTDLAAESQPKQVDTGAVNLNSSDTEPQDSSTRTIGGTTEEALVPAETSNGPAHVDGTGTESGASAITARTAALSTGTSGKSQESESPAIQKPFAPTISIQIRRKAIGEAAVERAVREVAERIAQRRAQEEQEAKEAREAQEAREVQEAKNAQNEASEVAALPEQTPPTTDIIAAPSFQCGNAQVAASCAQVQPMPAAAGAADATPTLLAAGATTASGVAASPAQPQAPCQAASQTLTALLMSGMRGAPAIPAAPPVPMSPVRPLTMPTTVPPALSPALPPALPPSLPPALPPVGMATTVPLDQPIHRVVNPVAVAGQLAAPTPLVAAVPKADAASVWQTSSINVMDLLAKCPQLDDAALSALLALPPKQSLAVISDLVARGHTIGDPSALVLQAVAGVPPPAQSVAAPHAPVHALAHARTPAPALAEPSTAGFATGLAQSTVSGPLGASLSCASHPHEPLGQTGDASIPKAFSARPVFRPGDSQAPRGAFEVPPRPGNPSVLGNVGGPMPWEIGGLPPGSAGALSALPPRPSLDGNTLQLGAHGAALRTDVTAPSCGNNAQPCGFSAPPRAPCPMNVQLQRSGPMFPADFGSSSPSGGFGNGSTSAGSCQATVGGCGSSAPSSNCGSLMAGTNLPMSASISANASAGTNVGGNIYPFGKGVPLTGDTPMRSGAVQATLGTTLDTGFGYGGKAGGGKGVGKLDFAQAKEAVDRQLNSLPQLTDQSRHAMNSLPPEEALSIMDRMNARSGQVRNVSSYLYKAATNWMQAQTTQRNSAFGLNSGSY